MVADAVGDVRGEPEGFADAVGVACTPPVLGPPPRLARTITPTAPRRMTITTATAAGRSQGGRSDRGPPLDGGRATDGLRAGAAMGARGMGAGVGALGGASTAATPVPRGSAGTVSPGFQTGDSTGVQVCCAGGEGAGASTGAGSVGGRVAKGEAGGTLSKVGAGLGASGSTGLGGSPSAGFGGSNGVQVGGAGGLVVRALVVAAGSTGAEGRAGASDQVGTEGAGVSGEAGAGGGGAGAGTGVGGNVIAGIEG